MDYFYMNVNDKVGCRHNRIMLKMSKKMGMGKPEDEATEGDGAVTMKTHEKK